jgi:hypothetical protein
MPIRILQELTYAYNRSYVYWGKERPDQRGEKMSYEERPTIAVILSIIGGALMLLGGSIAFVMLAYHDGNFGMMDGLGGMMGGYRDMMGGFGFPYGIMSGLMLVSLVSGVLVIVGAVMINIHPSQSYTWGIIVLVFSIISFVGMGGFLIGAVLGVVGGVLALTWRPKSKV